MISFRYTDKMCRHVRPYCVLGQDMKDMKMITCHADGWKHKGLFGKRQVCDRNEPDVKGILNMKQEMSFDMRVNYVHTACSR